MMADSEAQKRFSALVKAQWSFAARLLRHLGVYDADVEDAAQQVFLTLNAKLGEVEPGRERSFLAACCVHISARQRRARGRRQEVTDDSLWQLEDGAAGPERALEQRDRLRQLDEILASMPSEQRAVFVLFEIEELTMAEIADALEIPAGTVASRLRRARQVFAGATSP